MQLILSHLRRCIEDYDMIQPGDRIAVGVSGGKDSLVLLPFGRMSLMLKKDVALEIPYKTIHKVEIKEDMLNWRIELDTDEGRLALSAQQKELSEWRHSGTLSVGMSGLGSGILGSGPLKTANWHRANLDATLAALKALPGRKEEIA